MAVLVIPFLFYACSDDSRTNPTPPTTNTSDLCFGQQATVKTFGQDRYGRTIGDIILADGRVVNRELVSVGLAWWYRQYSKDETLRKLEEEAKNAKKGLWSDKNPQEPWEFRKNSKKGAVEVGKHQMTAEFDQEYVPATKWTEKRDYDGK